MVSTLQPLWLAWPFQNRKVPTDIACKIIETPPTATRCQSQEELFNRSLEVEDKSPARNSFPLTFIFSLIDDPDIEILHFEMRHFVQQFNILKQNFDKKIKFGMNKKTNDV